MTAGIYSITNTTNGKVYIGSSVNVRKRMTHHRGRLRKNEHVNSYLQQAWNKYGEAVFEFKLLEIVENSDDCVKLEQSYIDRLGFENLYNLAPIAGGLTGFKHSEATKERLRVANSGQIVTKSQRDQISATLTGRKNGPHSEATKAKLKAKAQARAADTSVAVRERWALAKANPGYAHHFSNPSVETRRKMSVAHRGKPRSEETCKRMSEAQKGRPLSDAHRASLVVAWARRKAEAGQIAQI